MERPRPRSLSTRLKHAALFVAIVWALAASFVAFELLSLSATDVMLANPEAIGDLALSQATQQSTACKVGPGEAAGQAGPLAAPEAKADAWMLGVHFGSDTQSGVPSRDRTNAQSVSEVERLAGRLAVPTPRPLLRQADRERPRRVRVARGSRRRRNGASACREVLTRGVPAVQAWRVLGLRHVDSRRPAGHTHRHGNTNQLLRAPGMACRSR